MNMRIVRAALTACLLGTAALAVGTAPLAPAFAASGPSVSEPVAKLLAPAQKLLQAKDFAGAMTLIKQAQALPGLTPFDTYSINDFLASAALGLSDNATADTAYEAMADSSLMPDTEKLNVLHNASILALQYKHYDKSIAYTQAYFAAGGAADPGMLSNLALAYYSNNDFANAQATAVKAIAAAGAGQAPPRGALEILLNAQLKAQKQGDAMQTMEQILTYYDDADDWGQIIDIGATTQGIRDVDALHVYRLLLAAKARGRGEDYVVAASLAQSDRYPVEAQAFMAAGQSAGVMEGGGKTAALNASINSNAARDRASIGAFDALARKSPSGEFDLRLAETYYGYGRYAEAAEAAQRALNKGGAKADPNEAHMVLGEALLMQGKTADAIAAFDAVRNAGPGMAKAQHLWLLFANRKYGTAAATP